MEKLTKDQREIARLKKVILAKESAINELKALVRQKNADILSLSKMLCHTKPAYTPK